MKINFRCSYLYVTFCMCMCVRLYYLITGHLLNFISHSCFLIKRFYYTLCKSGNLSVQVDDQAGAELDSPRAGGLNFKVQEYLNISSEKKF